jgi:hypothetical protein
MWGIGMRLQSWILCVGCLGLLAGPAQAQDPATAKDKTAASLKALLSGGFADVQSDVRADTANACAAVEKANSVFAPAMLEYMSHTGDTSFYRTMHHWYLNYCHREPDSPPADED